MSKELVVSATRHETRVGVLENDQLVEIYVERESQEGLAGSIHKGRVTRVLPGMQSAFVDVGLERDAFLYVSDFFDESAEFDESEDESGSSKRKSGRSREKIDAQHEPENDQSQAGEAAETSESEGRDRKGRRRRGRRGRRRGGKTSLPESKYATLSDKTDEDQGHEPAAQVAPGASDEEQSFKLLPGESLAKYVDANALDPSDKAEIAPTGDQSGLVGERAESEPQETVLSREASEDAEPEDSKSPEAPTEAVVQPFEHVAADDELSESPEPDDFDENDDEEDTDNEEEGTSEDSDDEDQGPNLEHELEEAERLAALVEDRDGEYDEFPEESKESDALHTEPEEFSSETGEDDADTTDKDPGDASSETSVLPGEPIEDPTEASQKTKVNSDNSDEDSAAPVPGQPGSARVRGRSGSSRHLQRRGRRGRRRSGRQRDNRQPVQQREPREHRAERKESPHAGPPPSDYKITDMLQKGNEILVQIAKEPLGKKGARITSHIALPGRYLVYMPTVNHVGVSRKIESFDERKRLRHVVLTHRTGMPGGFIVRTAGEGMPDEEIRGDMLFLYNLWLDIRQQAEERENPGLVHQDLDIVERILRDQLDEDFKAIWVDAEDEYERVLRFVERFQPSLLSRVKLYTRSRPIFEEFNVQVSLEKALRPKVWLKSGGYIVINQTEALVSVDVNTGKYVGKSDRLEDTIVNTNIEAAKGLVRQLRLRDLGGIIVIDFIDMNDQKNHQKVFQALEQALQADRAPTKLLQFNDFGLVAITRRRVKQSLERTLCDSCPTCNGSGRLKSVTTVILEILEDAHKMAPDMEPQKDVTLRVNPEVARTLKSRKNSYLQELETLLKNHVLVRSDGSLHRENFDIY